MTESNNVDQETVPTVEDAWMIRPCPVYDAEYKDCTSVKGRFHQYFVFGETLNCIPWKRDYDSCCRWQDNKDLKSAKEIVESEKNRRRSRLDPHYGNNVWTRRKTPPENWNAPLPEHIQREYETSYLNVKSKEMRGEIPSQTDPSNYCILM